MKKRIVPIISALLVFLTAAVSPVLAVEDESQPDGMVSVEELYLNIPTPQGWYVFTRDTPADDPAFSVWEGIDKKYMDQLFEQSSIYYNALEPNDASQEIVVTMVENTDIFDWNGLSDEEYQSFADEIMNADMEKLTGISGVKYGSFEMVDHPQCKLMKLDERIVNEDEQTALIQYVTIVNGQHLNITLRSYTGVISAADEAAFDQFVQGMQFTEIKEAPFNIISLLKSENLIVTLSIAGGAVLILVAVIVICVVVGSNKRKKRRLEQMRQEHQAFYEVQGQQMPEPQQPPQDQDNGQNSLPH